MRKEEILKAIKSQIKNINSKAEVILFGSRARGTAQQDSDWDILILLPEVEEVSLSEEQIYRDALFPLELHYQEAFSVFAMAKKVWEKQYNIIPFYQNIKKEGLLL